MPRPPPAGFAPVSAFPATPSSGGALSAGQLGGYDAAKAWPPSPRPSPPPRHPHSSSAPTQRAVRANGLAEGAGTHVLCSLLAAGCAAVLSLPPDIVLNRYQGAPAVGAHYSSVGDCASQLVRREGVLSLWRGLGPQYAKLAPIFLMTLPLYEQLRRLAGLGYLR